MISHDNSLPDGADSQILHPGSRRLFSHWETLRAERAFPTREEFEFETIKDLMPDLIVLERDNLRTSYRFRLAGTRVCRLFADNLTGKDVAVGWDSFETEIIQKHLGSALSEYQPALLRMRLKTDTNQIIAAELIALPVQMRESNRVQLIGGLFAFRDVNSIGHSSVVKRELIAGRMIWTEHRDVPRRLVVGNSVPPNFRNLSLIHGGKH